MARTLTDTGTTDITDVVAGDMMYVVRPSDGAAGSKRILVEDLEESLAALIGKYIWVFAGQMLEPQASNSIIAGWMPAVDVTIPSIANGNPSCAVAEIAATAETIFSIRKNNVEVATLTFAAAGTTGTFAIPGDIDLTAGTDRLTVKVPASADATLALMFFSIYGTR